mmetsp:Transcript_52082/g.138799  ORF Transcript_52082/g.138799 Transcript_52082/m.138799 type:complete len:286 (-) Transcript_52082:704-1561(-)
MFCSSSVSSTALLSSGPASSFFSSASTPSIWVSLASSAVSPSLFCAANLAFFASSAFFRLSSSSFFLAASASSFFISAAALATLSLSIRDLTRSLCSASGSPMRTTARLVKCGAENRSRTSFRLADERLPCTSMMRKLRRKAGVTWESTLLALKSSRGGMPRDRSGLSMEACAEAEGRVRLIPLAAAHSIIFRSLSSVKAGFFSRKWSAQSNTPFSGNATGKTISFLPSADAGTTSTSSCAASPTVLQVNGRGASGRGPKLTCKVTLLKVSVGKRGLPTRFSGIG